MEYQLMDFLHPVIITVLTTLASLLSVYIAKLLRKALDYISAQTKGTIFENALSLAHGIYIELEDKYKASGMGNVKCAEMERKLLEVYPRLTQEELDSINKAVWSSFNEEWNKRTIIEKRLDD